MRMCWKVWIIYAERDKGEGQAEVCEEGETGGKDGTVGI